jgi:Fe-S cluster biogenesis protein NfuA
VSATETYGMCTGCGSVEVALRNITGTRDLSAIGESAEYPIGYGCEVCA